MNLSVQLQRRMSPISSSAEDLERPLVVDLDGTLFKTDMAWELLLSCFLKHPFRFLRSIGELIKGLNHFKKYVAGQTEIDLSKYPISQDVIQFLAKQKSFKRRLILATGATDAVANAVLRAYPIFDEVLASNAQGNLVGSKKAAELERRFGKRGFDYIGNAMTDINVWLKCHVAYFSNANIITKMVLRIMHHSCIEVGRRSFRTSVENFSKALRVHQWAKNLLIILPFLAAHRPIEPWSVLQIFLGFIAFSLVASTGYLINDLVDIENDRNHSTKYRRPIAAGDLSIPNALIAALLLGGGGIFLAWKLVPLFALIVVGYFVLTTAYSFWIKKVVVLDVITLALLYTMRVIAGGALVSVKLSNWFLVFSIFFFFSLALLKRCTETWNMKGNDGQHVKGRGYISSDFIQISQFGTISGFMALLVYCLYIASPEISALYSKPYWLWFGLPILLFWICRAWLLASRGQIHEDPVMFAFKDPYSYMVGVLMGTIIYVAI